MNNSATEHSLTPGASQPTHSPADHLLGGVLGRAGEVLLWSLLFGGVVLGGTLSLLHLRLNAVDSVLVALASWLWFTALFSVLASAMALPGALVWPVWAFLVKRVPIRLTRLFQGQQATAAKRTGGGGPIVRPSTLFGLRVFASIYLVFGLLYGLTYDQSAVFSLDGWVGMYLYLLAAAAVIVVACWWVVGGLVGWMGKLDLRRIALSASLVMLVAHVAFAVLQRAEPAPPRRDARGVEVIAPSAAMDVEQVLPEGEPVDAASSNSAVPESRGFPAAHVVLLAFDGLDPHVVDRLVAEGRLPNFERLRKEGVYAPLKTLPSANSSVIWSTIYTGTLPVDHGIHDFFKIRLPGLGSGFFPVHRTWFQEMTGLLGKLGVGSKVFVERRDLRRFPVWEITDHFGVSAGVIDGYLNSYPAQSLDSKDSYFLAYSLDLFASQVEQGTMGLEDLGSFVQPVDFLKDMALPLAPDFEWQSAMLLELLETRTQPRFLNLYSHQPDALQHEAWRAFEPWRYRGGAQAEDEASGEGGTGASGSSGGTAGAIVAMHEAFDVFLGAAEAAASQDTVFVLVSDHGHSATVVHRLDTQHRHGPDGVIMLWGSGVRSGAELVAPHVVDVVPTVLALLGLPVAKDLPGRVLLEAFTESLEELADRKVESYEGMWQPPVVGKARDPRMLAAEIEKLKRMGYLGG